MIVNIVIITITTIIIIMIITIDTTSKEPEDTYCFYINNDITIQYIYIYHSQHHVITGWNDQWVSKTSVVLEPSGSRWNLFVITSWQAGKAIIICGVTLPIVLE